MNVPTLPTFTGLIPPRPEPLTHPYSQYKCFFLDENMFDHYLAITPFNRVHADVLCACAIRPAWLSVEDYAWFKQTQKMALSLDLDAATFGDHVLAQYNARHQPQATPLDEALPLPDLLQELS